MELGRAASERPSCSAWMSTSIISYDFGITQEEVDSNTWDREGQAGFLHVLHECCDTFKADIVFGCFVGGHKRGPLQSQVDRLNHGVIATKFCQNYMFAHKKRAGQVSEVVQPFPVAVTPHSVCDPQLVISAHQLRDDQGLSVILVVGNLRIRYDGETPSIHSKQLLLVEALTCLELHADGVMKEKVAPADAHTPALLLVGNVDLDIQHALLVCQAKQNDMEEFEPNNLWHVRSTVHGLSGDMMLCKGCYLESYEVPIGHSYSEEKKRQTPHDAVGAAVRLRRLPTVWAKPVRTPCAS